MAWHLCCVPWMLSKRCCRVRIYADFSILSCWRAAGMTGRAESEFWLRTLDAVRLWWESLSEAESGLEEYQIRVAGGLQEWNGVRSLHGLQMGLGISYRGQAFRWTRRDLAEAQRWGCRALLSCMYVGTKGWELLPLHTGANVGQRLLSYGRRPRGGQDWLIQVLLHFLFRAQHPNFVLLC